MDITTVRDLRAGSLASQRFRALLVGAFAVTALGLALLGIYAVVSHAVEQRRRVVDGCVNASRGARGMLGSGRR